MLPHTPQEFRVAERVLHKLVLSSDFFPQRAQDADWFQSYDEVEAQIDASRIRCDLEGKISLKQEGRPSLESASSADTASTVSLASCGDSPLVRRATIDMAVMNDVNTLRLGLPLPTLAAPAAQDAVDDTTKSGLPLPLLTRRASLDNGQLPNLVIPSSASDATKTAKEQWDLIVKKGATKEYSPVPSIQEKYIEYGGVLGTGGFCEVRLASLKMDKKDKRKSHQRYAMKYLSPTKLAPKEEQDDNGNKKVTKPSRNKQFERGIADLAIEARFLTLLSHENIISLHYVGQGSLEEQFNCQGENNYYHQFGYFLLLDPLYESLAQRIEGSYIPGVFLDRPSAPRRSSSVSTTSSSSSSSWWKRMMHTNSTSNILLDSWKMQLAQRLEGLRGIASALQYLHDECRSIFRDTKPDNIGFYRRPHANCRCGKRATQRHHSPSKQECTCYDEIPKLFDFGLCKELKPKYLKAHPNHDPHKEVDTYNLTARSGSRRYMSPEVAFGEPYNEKADVYSFGIVLYEVASLVTPFEGFSLLRHEEEILACGERPNIMIPSAKKALVKVKKGNVSYKRWQVEPELNRRNKHLALRTKCVWTTELKKLIDDCWHIDMRERPGMKDVVKILDNCIQELTNVKQPDQQQVKTKHLVEVKSSCPSYIMSQSTAQETECLNIDWPS